NSYLKVATEFGLLGFFVWATLFVMTYLYFRKVRKSRPRDRAPTRLQLYAFSLAIGLLGIAPGIYTHSYNDLDTLYWFVALSCILYNIQFPASAKEEHAESVEELPEQTAATTQGQPRQPAVKVPQPTAVS
ncbi:MAG: hypothetical protein ACE5I1_14685, partial [bacterium]